VLVVFGNRVEKRKKMKDKTFWKETEVLVLGGGISGAIAAIAASRTGAKTLLIEKNACFGGTATASMVGQFFGFYHGNDKRVVKGLPGELLKRLETAGGANGFYHYVMAELTDSPVPMTSFPFDPELLKIVLDEFLAESGVDLLLCSKMVDVLKKGKKLTGAVVEGLSDTKLVSAKCIIDATGDAEVASRAGVKCSGQGREKTRTRQPMSLVFRLSNVDVTRARSLPREKKEEYLKEGLGTGALAWRSLAFSTTPSGSDAVCMMSRVMRLDSLDEEDFTKANILGRNQVKKTVQFLQRRVPGFEKATLVNIASQIGVRETRQIVGEYTLTEEDVLNGRAFPDSIAVGSGPLDIHDPDGIGITLKMPVSPFEIPYRCLIPIEIDGLIVTGRCISATRSAMAAARHMGTAMALGHAAGTAAAISVKTEKVPRSIDIHALRNKLVEQAAIISTEVFKGS
jgi:hypothetical protein